jgi:tRNA threonylcarbamoyladenosine biosynthesis protein TsaE
MMATSVLIWSGMRAFLPQERMTGYRAAMLLHLPDLEATEALGARIAAGLRPGDAVLLEGPLGAGKSALARALLRALLRDPALHVPSPTFTLVQAYEASIGPVAHFDLWRLDGPGAVLELGWDEARDGVVLVEWPDRLGELRPAEALTVTLAHGEGDAREALIEGWADRPGWAG